MLKLSTKASLSLGLVFLAAFALRAYRIEYQSIWGDEAYSIWRSGLPLSEIPWQVAKTGNLAPLYYFLLHFWQGLAGSSELVIRFFSLFFGLLALPVAFKVMERLHSREAGVLAALLGAASPFWVYYAQEAKMYAQAAFLVLLASYLFLRAFDNKDHSAGACPPLPSPSGGQAPALQVEASRSERTDDAAAPEDAASSRDSARSDVTEASRDAAPPDDTAQLIVRYPVNLWTYLAYGAASAAAVYTHYFAIFAILAHGVYLASSRRRWHGFRPWMGSQALAAVLVLPWAGYAASALSWAGSSVKRGSIGLDSILPQVLRAFSVGASLGGDLLPWVLAGALALLLLGVLASSGRTRIFLLAGLILPVLGVYGISFQPHPGWARYFMAASPAYYGLVATGLAFLFRRHYAFGALVLLALAPSGLALANYYFDPHYARYDYRAQIQEMSASSGPEDGVIANGPEDFPSFFYYFDGGIPSYILPNKEVSSRSEVEAFLKSLRRSGLWLVKYMPPDFDGDNVIEGWLRLNGFPLETKWVENVTFTYFSLPSDAGAPEPGAWGPATFEKGIRLLGYRARITPWGSRSVLQLTLLWQADSKVDQAYTVFVHALDGAGKKLGQGDSEPAGGLSPTVSWKPGERVLDRHGVPLPETFQKEGARLEVGLYDLKSGARLQVLDNQGRTGGTALVLPFP